ncbi:DNA polymerase III subunit gamma/tau [Thiomicrospira sp. R3]|uniref:DNA polymerase III subunit gamma/tau n=1 Tax=Thiomicrospira sp. R3 TaxID=3035472 RepID=UPI00259B6E05|nr:DNA polymerase III subunit gamma/tau [Thiomicrospira sp. R3]WFE67994.1 DNA polymerase III subunit gamma/tau [Thiomicrospira sp. R3]
MRYTVLARKWRPKNFSELVGQTHVMQALSNALDSQRLHHAYLFTGTRGVGKTTIARIFAKALNCEQGISSTPCGVCSVCQSVNEGRFVDLIEIDAASRTKVEDTREILDNVQYAPTQGRYKVYLIDEVHMLSKSSFNALLKTLEEPPEHVKFLLATTDPHKLPITVLSRCLQFNLLRLTTLQIQQHLVMILQQEGLEFEPNALALIAKSADGSVRDALSLLDQAIAYCGGEIRFEAVQSMLGLVDQGIVQAILQALAEDSAEQIKQVLLTLSSLGVDYNALLSQLLETLHQVCQSQILGELLDEGLLAPDVLTDLAQRLSAEQVQIYYQIGLLARQDINLAPDIRIGFEMSLLRMLAFNPVNMLSNAQEVVTVSRHEKKTPTHVTDLLKQAKDTLSTAQNTQNIQNNRVVKPSSSEKMVSTSPNTLTANPAAADLSFFPDLQARFQDSAAVSATEPEPCVAFDQAMAFPESPAPAQPSAFEETHGEALSDNQDRFINPPANDAVELPNLAQPKPIEVWAQMIEQVGPEGMALELARRSILMDYNNQAWWLSVSPAYLMAKTEVAQARLLEAARHYFGQAFVIHFVEYSGEHCTPDDYEQVQKKQHHQDAIQAIKQDPNTQIIQDTLNMQLLEKTIQPV